MTTLLVAPRGLKGLVVADTTIGSVMGDQGFYHYRQYNATDLARTQRFEAVAEWLIDGTGVESPDPRGWPDDPLDDPAPLGFSSPPDSPGALMAAARTLPTAVMQLLPLIAGQTRSAQGGLRAVIPVLVDDIPTVDLDRDAIRTHALAVAGATPAVLAAIYRASIGRCVLPSNPEWGVAADYLAMVTGSPPNPVAAKALEIYLCLTADHGFNASTFTVRVITSTGAGVGAALAGAVGALSGPLHGGAPSFVLDMLDQIGPSERTEAWVAQQLDAGKPIMGFGHPVYRVGDPRSRLLHNVAESLAARGFDPDGLVTRSAEIEQKILDLVAQAKPDAVIATNVEYWAAVVLHLVGLPRAMFSSTFTVSRMVGWAAHLIEQAGDNKIMRPKARYVGPEPVGV